MIIESWLGEMTLDKFRREHYQLAPLAVPERAVEEMPLLTWDIVRKMVETPEGPDILVVQSGRFLADLRPRSGVEMEALISAGRSLVFRGCEHYDNGLRALGDAVAGDIGGEPNVHVFVTPGGTQGFGWHYDCEDVFIVQTRGIKEYFLRQNTVNPAPSIDAMPRDMHYERETSNVMLASTLAAGDWLYIPRGWWHAARSIDDSLSISVGVLSPAARGTSGRPSQSRYR